MESRNRAGRYQSLRSSLIAAANIFAGFPPDCGVAAARKGDRLLQIMGTLKFAAL